MKRSNKWGVPTGFQLFHHYQHSSFREWVSECVLLIVLQIILFMEWIVLQGTKPLASRLPVQIQPGSTVAKSHLPPDGSSVVYMKQGNLSSQCTGGAYQLNATEISFESINGILSPDCRAAEWFHVYHYSLWVAVSHFRCASPSLAHQSHTMCSGCYCRSVLHRL